MSDANKALTRRFIDEVFSKGNLAAVDELVADDFVDHSPPPDVPPDKVGMKQIVEMFRSAFPDLTVTVEDMVAEGDKVAVRVVTHGTHQGELMGIAATGRTVAGRYLSRQTDARRVQRSRLAKKGHKCGAVSEKCPESGGSSRFHVERGFSWERNNVR